MMKNSGIGVVFAFVVAFIIAFATTPFAKKFAFKIGAVDVPKDNRRMHRKPMALLGGLAIYCGFLISVLCFADFILPSGTLNWGVIGILFGSTIIMILGIFDDLKPLSAKFKFFVQIVAAAIPVILNVRVFAISNPFTSEQLIRLPEWLSITFSVFWIVGITNAVNLIDGLDGLAAGVSSIASVALLSILLLQHNASGSLIVLSAALAGACFGFLPYNFNPAKIFMGDTGATFLGFVLACISIQGPFKTYVAFAVPMLVLGLPIFDTLFAIIRRLLKGQSPMSPDRGHLHHKLVDKGFSQRTSVIILYGLSIMLAISAILMLFGGFTRALILIISVLVFAVCVINMGSNDMFSFKDDKQDDDDNGEEN